MRIGVLHAMCVSADLHLALICGRPSTDSGRLPEFGLTCFERPRNGPFGASVRLLRVEPTPSRTSSLVTGALR